jgi:hypothetical protein
MVEMTTGIQFKFKLKNIHLDSITKTYTNRVGLTYLLRNIGQKTKVVSVLKYHPMRIYGEEDAKLHAFLTSTPAGNEWSVP